MIDNENEKEMALHFHFFNYFVLHISPFYINKEHTYMLSFFFILRAKKERKKLVHCTRHCFLLM